MTMPRWLTVQRLAPILGAAVVLGACSGISDDVSVAEEAVGGSESVTGASTGSESSDETGTAPADLLVDVDVAPLRGCSVKAGSIDLTPVWSGQNEGMSVRILRDGVEIFTTEPAETERKAESGFSDVDVELGRSYTYSVQAIGPDDAATDVVSCGSGQLLAAASELTCGVRLSDGGLPEVWWDSTSIVQSVAVSRDGQTIAEGATSPFTDDSAPLNVSSRYSIVATDTTSQGRPPIQADCGDTTPNLAEVGGSSDLATAIERANAFPSPYQYVELTPICPGCSGSVELYLVPSPEQARFHSVEQVWVDGAPTAGGAEIWMIDPFQVPALLRDSQASGQDITFDVDRSSGIIRTWTIGGVGAAYRCLEVDTRPIEMRSSRCESNLLPG